MKIAARFLAIVAAVFSLSTLTLTSPAFAQPAPANPQPCKNPVLDENHLTENYITNYNTDPEGGAPIVRSIKIDGNKGDTVQVDPQTFTFTVDFSNLQALFGATNSNYLEGRFQDTSHRQENILALSSSDFNLFHGPGQKAAPKVMVDELKKNYIEYVYNKPTLAESANTYTDIEGNGNPKTIYDLVNEFGLPNPPEANADKTKWRDTWGRYWEKIPTSYSEFYEGQLAFHYFFGNQPQFEQFQKIKGCPPRIVPPIRIVLPEFFRTTHTSDQLNRLIVPLAAQRDPQHQILENSQASTNVFSKILSFCWELITNPSTATESLKKIIKVSLDFAGPKIAFAEEEKGICLKPLQEGKEGEAPYCPLPLEERQRLGSSVSCINKDDPNKLEKDNPNVICTFTLTWPGGNAVIDPDNDDTCILNEDGTYTCYPKLRIWPNLLIPWIAEIWNNTLYSDEFEGKSISAPQVTGRPGFFSHFTPKTIFEQKTYNIVELMNLCDQGNQDACKAVNFIDQQCGSEVGAEPFDKECINSLFNFKFMPGETVTQSELKERFVGAVDECGKEFVRDLALKPKALQEYLGIEQACKTSD